MPRNGSGVMSKTAGGTAVSGATIDSSDFNTLIDDIISDLNAARPVSAGGTGVTSLSALRTALGLVIGTDVQAYDAELAAIAGLVSAADRLAYFTGSGTASLATFTAAGRALVDDADAAAQCITLGLGTAAVANTGTSAGNIPVLDGSAKMPAVDGSALTNLTMPTGGLVQSVVGTYATNTNITSTIPYDDTIPQSGEGTQIISVSLTPKSTSNKFRVRWHLSAASASAGLTLISAVFHNATASAIGVKAGDMPSNGVPSALNGEFEYVPGVLTAETIKLNVGTASGDTIRLNGLTSGRKFGGIDAAYLIVEEIKA